MDLRPALDELAAQHALSPEATARLHALAGLDVQPAGLERSVPLGAALLAALLGGLGIIFWVAANWNLISRSGRFALLEGIVAVMCAGAIWLPRARLPLSLLAALAIGALFAYFGQTYQTGADPWQLFALWAALALPLSFGVRRDALWSLWAVVAMTAIVLWTHAHTGHSWRVDPQDTWVHLAGWTAALLIAVALSPAFARRTGAGLWSMRLALTQLAMLVTMAAVYALFQSGTPSPSYWLGMLLLAGAGAAFSTRALHDTFALSVFGLGLNVTLVGGLARMLFEGNDSSSVPELLLLGIVAAVLLAATVHYILLQSRRHGEVSA